MASGEFGKIIGAMQRLGGIMQAASNKYENIYRIEGSKNYKGHSQKFQEGQSLRDSLSSATTAPVITKKITEILKKGFGGAAEGEISENLKKSTQYRAQSQQAWARSERLRDQISRLNTLWNQRNLTANTPAQVTALNNLGNRIQELRTQEQRSFSRSGRLQNASRAALNRSQDAALGAGSGLPGLGPSSIVGLSKFAKFLPAIGTGIQVATVAVNAFSKALQSSVAIIDKYSKYSMGGMQAASILYVRDLRRNIDISHKLSDSMVKFAKAQSDMKDAWKSTNILIEKFQLGFGTLVAKTFDGIGRFIDPFAKQIDKFIGDFKNMGAAQRALLAVTSPLAFALGKFGEAIGWKTEKEQQEEFKAKIARRKAFFRNDQQELNRLGGIQQDDIHPIERILGILQKKFPMQDQAHRFGQRLGPAPPAGGRPGMGNGGAGALGWGGKRGQIPMVPPGAPGALQQGFPNQNAMNQQAQAGARKFQDNEMMRRMKEKERIQRFERNKGSDTQKSIDDIDRLIGNEKNKINELTNRGRPQDRQEIENRKSKIEDYEKRRETFQERLNKMNQDGNGNAANMQDMEMRIAMESRFRAKLGENIAGGPQESINFPFTGKFTLGLI